MLQKIYRSRIHLLAARDAPVIVVLQRKRAKLFHVMKIATDTCAVEHGSWFHGKLHVLKCDVSFNGRYMIYLAYGANNQAWNGICQVPWLQTIVESPNLGVVGGGGVFSEQRQVLTSGWLKTKHKECDGDDQFDYVMLEIGDDQDVLTLRLDRDGFDLLENSHHPMRLLLADTNRDLRDGDVRSRRFSPDHPELQVKLRLPHTFDPHYSFSLSEYPGLIDDAAWATWDTIGNLWVARPGYVERYTRTDFATGRPSFSLDVEPFEPPSRQQLPLQQSSDPL
ncbi:MAG: hypothetical protein ABL898_14905 [Hyphomicrobiaceae bacterium]